ncbi:AFR661Wp [Eremothecium gossypii ATCC 10895]|uniref:AFR661Wp n=1 Tax=Eremothecium gossypii (strain ATCC 10895 / CBS 109.51 / FGSC 9923 / NRRL Y-1056) TaxID=284811 RepID=Q752B4_EREGS|nr:AFR661Wp [Eremothecium gossypii ATCC 10895]AAS54033.1 AFR661Wp [Eremothecium gossypii ATCC 10895]AEY98348.1 FAFR661Wp [Eremothecium gossypii FDAG1]
MKSSRYGTLQLVLKKTRSYLKRCGLQDRVLMRRVLKSTINTTCAFIFCLIPAVRQRLASEPSMLPLISVMVHPGRRVSSIIQSTIYVITGLLLGLLYALLGRFAAQRCLGDTWHSWTAMEQYTQNYKRYESALAVLAVFEICMLFFHGWMRVVNHNYFHVVFPLFIVVHFSFLSPLSIDAAQIAKTFTIPFYLGISMSLFWNLVLYPEFGSTYLGNTAIDTMNEIHHFLNNAVNFFISIDNEVLSDSLYGKKPCTLARLLTLKNEIEIKINNCALVLEECTYEISYSYLSPSQLNGLIMTLKSLQRYLSGVTNACQMEFLLLGKAQRDSDSAVEQAMSKEISHADAEKLLHILRRLKFPIFELHKTLNTCFYMLKILLADAYDVDFSRVRVPSIFKEQDDVVPVYRQKTDLPKDYEFQSTLRKLQDAVSSFDTEFRKELANIDHDLLTPSDEMFLLSSFLMNFKESTSLLMSLVHEVEQIHKVRKDRERKGWLRGKSLWCPALESMDSFKRWFQRSHQSTTENDALRGTLDPGSDTHGETVAARPNIDDLVLRKQQSNETYGSPEWESLPTASNSNTSDRQNIRHLSLQGKTLNIITDALCRWLRIITVTINCTFRDYRNNFRFAFQVTIALTLASFPMYIPATREWYMKIRGTWVGFVCILCLEPNVGATYFVFLLRAVGVILGAFWAYVSYQAGMNQSNPYLEVFITIFGTAPGFYYLLGSPHIKAAIIQIISIYAVLLATIIPSSIGGSIGENVWKRILAVGYGGGIALLVQSTAFPITARDQLNEELAFVVGCLAEIEVLYAGELDAPHKITISKATLDRISFLSSNAKSAINRASAYKTIARREPRLKGSYKEIEKVFTQMIFVLRQIIERMDNIEFLRKQYGFGIVEELNHAVYPYRRHVAAALGNQLRSIQEALINKRPLPQYLPSARIAQKRLLNKVRDTLYMNYRRGYDFLSSRSTAVADGNDNGFEQNDDEGILLRVKRPRTKLTPSEIDGLRERYLSWNATGAGFAEVIEYTEELIQLTIFLVGVNEFKYGFLSRPLYSDWAAQAVTQFDAFVKGYSAVREDVPMRRDHSGVEGDHLTVYSDMGMELPQTKTKTMHSHARRGASKLNLARIASKDTVEPETKLMSGNDDRLDLQLTKTLGDLEDEDEDLYNEQELPIALRRYLSRKKD